MSNYRRQLSSPRWQRRRLEIFKRDLFSCVYCGDTETELHVHHEEYEKGKKAWEYEDFQLSTVCKHCHVAIEFNKKFVPITMHIEKTQISNNEWYVSVTGYDSNEMIYLSVYKYYLNKDFCDLLFFQNEHELDVELESILLLRAFLDERRKCISEII